jgi:hypothetical protein
VKKANVYSEYAKVIRCDKVREYENEKNPKGIPSGPYVYTPLLPFLAHKGYRPHL